MSSRLALSLAAMFFLLAWPAKAESPPRRGVNLSGWLSQINSASGFTRQYFESWITDADLQLIKSWGFDHVRLCVDPDVISDEYRYISRAVEMILSHGLKAVVDLHPNATLGKSLAKDDRAVESFSRYWRGLAKELSRFPSDRVFFEILNEPETGDQARLQRILARVAGEIRKQAPKHTIILAGYSTPSELISTRPLRDPNVVYDFHFYLPGIFTHQGADWTVDYYKDLANVPYPLSPGNADGILARIPDKRGRDEFRKTYGSDSWPNSIRRRAWDASRIEESITRVKAWAEKFHRGVVCGEFGVYPKNADRTSRVRWINDVRSALEKNGMGWAVWDYKGKFAIKDDPDVLRALGLK